MTVGFFAAVLLICSLQAFIFKSIDASGIDARGPFSIPIAYYQYDYAFLTRDKDNCTIYNDPIESNFKFGNKTYNQITVCGNGYIIPGISGVPESAPPMLNGDNFDTPATPVIAIALIENDRNDGLFDYDCVLSKSSMIVNKDKYCAAIYSARQSQRDGSTRTQLEAIDFGIEPIYGAGATNAPIVREWVTAGSNIVNYWTFSYIDWADRSLKQSLFSDTMDAHNFINYIANNVIMRQVSNSLMGVFSTLSGDNNFVPDWAVCISWYKVGQPPAIIDRQNSFQLALGCKTLSSNNNVASKCAVIFDYYQIEYYQQNGQVMRAGATGPDLPPFELPGSGDAATVLNLASDSNVNVPGVWFYEIEQCSECYLLRPYNSTNPEVGQNCSILSLPEKCPVSVATTPIPAASQAATPVPAASQAATPVPAASQATTPVPAASQATTPASAAAQATTPASAAAQTTTAVLDAASTSNDPVTAETTAESTMTADTTLALVEDVNISLISVDATSANLSVVDFGGFANISNIVGFCESDVDSGCKTVVYDSNIVAELNAWLHVSGMLPGTPYDITVNKSTYGGIADVFHFNTFTFCTVPNPSLMVSKVNSTAVIVTVSIRGGNFETGNLTFSPRNVRNVVFDASEFPLLVVGLIKATIYNFIFVFGVGSSGKCGVGGPVYSDRIFIEYNPGLFASVALSLEVTTSSVYITVADASGGSGTIADLEASCVSQRDSSCSSVGQKSTNSNPSDPGWVSYTGLTPGLSYEITIENATFNGKADTLIRRAIVFCTDPLLDKNSFVIDILNSSSVIISLTSDAGNFDNGSVSAYNISSGALVAEQSFDKALFPITIHDLPSIPEDSPSIFNFSFFFSVGSGPTRCGDGGSRMSEQISVLFPPNKVKSSEGNRAAGSHLMTSPLIFTIFVHLFADSF